jgi:hypothetical protein
MIPERSDDFDPNYYYYDDRMGDLDSDDGVIDNRLSVKHLYHSSTWKKSYIEYDPKPKELIDTSRPTGDFPRFSTFLKLFGIIWPNGVVLLRIVKETNQYTATTNEYGISPSGAT